MKKKIQKKTNDKKITHEKVNGVIKEADKAVKLLEELITTVDNMINGKGEKHDS